MDVYVLDAMRALEDYRIELEFSVQNDILNRDDVTAHEVSYRISLIDEFFKMVDDGLGEPVQVAYTLYLKYMECMFKSMGNKASYMFEIMADEAGYLIDYFNECCC